MSYAATRRLILVLGLGVLLVIVAVLFVRRVETVEMYAALLFIPVFLAALAWGLLGGVTAGVAAALVYARMRQPAIDAVGDERFVNLILGRAFGYIGFGTLSGWAARQLEASLEKLDVYDVVDDPTGLHNARFFVQDTDLEMARAARYQTLFSVVVVDVPSAALDRLGRRARAAALRHLGRRLREAVRSMDRAVHARDGATHRFVVVCPETGPEGARIFADRLADSITDLLRERGVRLADGAPLARSSYTYPGDDAGLSALREAFAAIDRAEHPDHPVDVTEPPPGAPGAPA